MGRKQGPEGIVGCLCLCIIMPPILIVMGLTSLKISGELTQQTCTVANTMTVGCSFECNCVTSKKTRRCSTCSGSYWRYVIDDDKCPNNLNSDTGFLGGGSDCNPTAGLPLYEQGESFTCWVPDCDRASYYMSADGMETAAWGMLGAGAMCFMCMAGLCVAVVGLYKAGRFKHFKKHNKKMKKYDKKYDKKHKKDKHGKHGYHAQSDVVVVQQQGGVPMQLMPGYGPGMQQPMQGYAPGMHPQMGYAPAPAPGQNMAYAQPMQGGMMPMAQPMQGGMMPMAHPGMPMAQGGMPMAQPYTGAPMAQPYTPMAQPM